MENTVKQRLIKYLKYKGISQREFAELVGVSSGYVNAIRKSIQPNTLHKIAIRFTDLNTGWIITGEGEMLKEEDTVIENHQTFDEEYWKDLVSSQQKTIERQAKTIEEQSNVIASLISQKDKRAV